MKVAIALLLVGCASQHSTDPTPTPTPLPVSPPPACTQSVTLVGAVSTSPTRVGPFVLDAAGADICVRLDATQMQRAHFMASSDERTGTTSGLDAVLQRPDGTAVLDGWDVSVGETAPKTFLNVEWDPPVGQITDVVVWVRASGAPAGASIELDLFDPLE
jgi:hypothetical protein